MGTPDIPEDRSRQETEPNAGAQDGVIDVRAPYSRRLLFQYDPAADQIIVRRQNG